MNESSLKNILKIKSEISTLKKSLLNFKFQKSTGQLEKTAEIKKMKVLFIQETLRY